MSDERDDMMYKARAFKAAADALAPRWEGRDNSKSEDLELEAFMALFHPEKSKDRKYMADLKQASQR